MSPKCISCDERSSRNEREYLQCEECDNWVCEDCECPCELEEKYEEELPSLMCIGLGCDETNTLQCEECDNWVCEDCECPCEPEETVIDDSMVIDYCWNEALGRCVEV